MMPNPKEDLLSRVATLLDALGPFPPDAKRDEKWRTTDQLANELGLFGCDAVARLNKVLRGHEAEGLERLKTDKNRRAHPAILLLVRCLCNPSKVIVLQSQVLCIARPRLFGAGFCTKS